MGENVVKKEKREIKILGYTIWRLIVYFIVYSILGFIIETAFGAITKGVIESRKSFLYGPFCGIYGLGAVAMIVSLQYFNKNNNQLFIAGFIVGSIIEYIISLIGELIFNIKWWDYSNMPLNIHGRVCIYFSIFWGLLAIYLMTYVNPKIDKFIEFMKKKISIKVLKGITIATTIFIIFDVLISCYALQMFTIRIVHENNLEIESKNFIDEQYEKIYNNPKKTKFIYKYFGDEKMIKTFPNIKLKDIHGNMLYFENYVGDIKPYYYKFK